MKGQIISLFALVLVACSTPEKSRITDAGSAPLVDLNIVRANIPAVLQEAKKQPYALPADQTCSALAGQVQSLDEVLGPDLDAPSSESNPSLIERGVSTAGDAAVDAIKGAAEGILPFRGWLRKLTGAERHSKEVSSAIVAGSVRRSFLKGFRVARNCS